MVYHVHTVYMVNDMHSIHIHLHCFIYLLIGLFVYMGVIKTLSPTGMLQEKKKVTPAYFDVKMYDMK